VRVRSGRVAGLFRAFVLELLREVLCGLHVEHRTVGGSMVKLERHRVDLDLRGFPPALLRKRSQTGGVFL
jgi:hypothetical protein